MGRLTQRIRSLRKAAPRMLSSLPHLAPVQRLSALKRAPRRVQVFMGICATLMLISLVGAIVANIARPARANGSININALLHDSRDPLYRSPSGAAPTGQAVVLRLRTAAHDAHDVTLRVWNTADNNGQGGQELYPAKTVYSDSSYDYWQATVPAQSGPRTLWYKWRVTSADGSTQVWYEDHYDTFLKSCDQTGGVGQVFFAGQDSDCSYRLNVYVAGFDVPTWMKHAVVYQIFVDRFFNGLTSNDALVQPDRYDSKGCIGPDGKPTTTGYYLHTNWNDEPSTPPQGCDFYGGDLQGIIAKLNYLHGLGVNVLYLNPIFMADSNHKYDTTDYTMIDPHFGNLAVWQQLVQQADAMGMHIILDGVFNHTSSGSLYFDTYGTWQSGGADETQTSRYENWYQFTNWPAYSGWFGFNSLPQLTENQGVRNFIFAGDPNFVQDANDAAIRQRYGEAPLTVNSSDNSVAKYWLAQGANGWRLDVAESKSDAWWQQFRTAIKSIDPNAISIGEHWGDASQWVLGDQQDGTMNYRFRDAVINFFDKGGIDADTGHDSHEPYTASQFDAHLQTVLENYPAAAVYASLNLVDSHDTGRILWELGDTTGASADQIARAKQTLRLIALFQMTWMGAPTIYYGDEAGQTQTTYADSGGVQRVDPGTRRTFPWDHQDTSLESWYTQWIQMRNANPVFATGAETTLLTDDSNRIFAYQRRDDSNMGVVVLNADAPANAHTVTLNLSNTPDGTTFSDAATQEQFTVSGGKLIVPVSGDSGRVLLGARGQVKRPTTPSGLQALHQNGANQLSWSGITPSGSTTFNVYRSPICGGLYTKVNSSPVAGTTYTDQGTDNNKTYFYVVRSVDAQGVESGDSNCVKPILRITAAGGLAPVSLNATLNVQTSAITATVTAPGSTDQTGQGPWVTAQIGYGPTGSAPSTWTAWSPMSWQAKTSDGKSDIYSATTMPETLGQSNYVARFSGDDGATWTYAYADSAQTKGTLTVSAATDTTPPAAPTGLAAQTASQQVTLTWQVTPNPSAGSNIWRYHILRATSQSGQFSEVGVLLASAAGSTPSFTDNGLTNGTTYYYEVTAESNAQITGPAGGPLAATPHVPAVHVTFVTAIPYYTATSDSAHGIYIAGDAINNWTPGATPMTKVDDTHWQISLDLPLGKTINYKYTRGDWSRVEKSALGDEINNRQYTLPNQDGAHVTIYDSVASWVDVNPPANAVAVQWNVQVPNTTPASAQVYLAGDAWSWSPSGAPMRYAGGGYWQYTQVFPAATTINYKYTRGTWATVEADANFNDVANRTLTVSAQQTKQNNGSTYSAFFQTDTVANWKDHPSAGAVVVTFNVTIPSALPSGVKVYIAGDAINNWSPNATPLTQIDATHWTYNQTLAPGQTVQYKYTLGDWPYVETNTDGSDINNRQMTVADQGGGAMTVNDTVAAWKAVP
ncbi:MAG TPA: alpha amylase N-terminal ig-like domain-containing protein [Ktedonobacterales bacterium]